FHSGLVVVFTAAVIMTIIAAIASLIRGKKFVHLDLPTGSVDLIDGNPGLAPVEAGAGSGSGVSAPHAVRDR
ncbi:MAG: transporter, partial [Frondihabitans sp.]|nr:transporter [Frondihabitans sp.]